MRLFRPVTVSVSVLSLQREKKGIVMVNFYNDYVTCSKDATLSDVAGKPHLLTTCYYKAG